MFNVQYFHKINTLFISDMDSHRGKNIEDIEEPEFIKQIDRLMDQVQEKGEKLASHLTQCFFGKVCGGKLVDAVFMCEGAVAMFRKFRHTFQTGWDLNNKCYGAILMMFQEMVKHAQVNC